MTSTLKKQIKELYKLTYDLSIDSYTGQEDGIYYYEAHDVIPEGARIVSVDYAGSNWYAGICFVGHGRNLGVMSHSQSRKVQASLTIYYEYFV